MNDEPWKADLAAINRARAEMREQQKAAKRAERARSAPPPKPLRKKRTADEIRERRRLWFRERAAADPVFRLNRIIRHAVNKSLRGAKRGQGWQALVGYSVNDLKADLETKFLPGMTWENIGSWHVDHRRPISSFAISGPDCREFREAWALSNLQPLWAAQNLSKGARWEP